jgi:hypothetical protein
VIAKAPENGKRGKDTYGLLGYLFGPGRANEHVDPHLVAAWDPEWLAGGAFAEQHRGWLARLGREIDAAMDGHEVQLPGGHVYHVVLSVPQQDGELGDAVWRELVDEAIDRMGFGPDAEGRGGCRWVAVHHGPSTAGNDHVHLVVNLVRGDGRIADTYRDWPRWRAWCLDVEARLGLTPTSPANKTAPVRPTRAETEKAVRMGREQPSRDYLRQIIRTAGTRASTAAEFIALVRENGVRIEPRWSAADKLAGYRVALPIDYSDSSTDGLVWFGGSRLARDLSAPRLTARWSSAPVPWPPLPRDERDHGSTVGRAERRAAVEDATRVVIEARSMLAAPTADRDDDGGTPVVGGRAAENSLVEGVANAALDMLVVTADAIEGYEPGPLTAAAVAYERAALIPLRVQPSTWAPIAAELRTASRRMARAGVIPRTRHSGAALTALILALAALVAEIAAWREQAGHRSQSVAAWAAASQLRQDVTAHATSTRAGQPAHAAPEGSPLLSVPRLPPPRSRPGNPRTFRPPESPGPSQVGKAR